MNGKAFLEHIEPLKQNGLTETLIFEELIQSPFFFFSEQHSNIM